jgi:hypothetical protein
MAKLVNFVKYFKSFYKGTAPLLARVMATATSKSNNSAYRKNERDDIEKGNCINTFFSQDETTE